MINFAGYTLRYTRKTVPTSTETIDLPPSSRDYTIRGLTPTVTYTIQIYARTRIGPGPPIAADIDPGIPPGKLYIKQRKQLYYMYAIFRSVFSSAWL